MGQEISYDFQTPLPVASYMASMVPSWAKTILEPTPGAGNIVSRLKLLGGVAIIAPDNYFEMEKQRYDCIVTNPPFSSKYAFCVPDHLKEKGMKLGYHILKELMGMSDNIIALVPWFTISDSDVRLRYIKKYGLKSITALPRKTFRYARIQTCILELEKGFSGSTEFKVYDLFNKHPELFNTNE